MNNDLMFLFQCGENPHTPDVSVVGHQNKGAGHLLSTPLLNVHWIKLWGSS